MKTKKKKEKVTERPILIIDGQNRMHAAYHAYSKLTYNKQSVAVIYGMPSMMQTLIRRFYPKRTIICWDEARSKVRMEAYPEYKATRTTSLYDRDDLERQKNVVKDMFYSLGIAQVVNKEEGDDNIYMLYRKIREKSNKKIIIVTGDKDFNQLLTDPKVTIFNEVLKQELTAADIKEYYNYSPEQFLDYFTFLGDGSDNIKGYPGFGQVKAQKFLEVYPSVKDFLADPKAEYTGIDKPTLAIVHERICKLMDLEYYYENHIKIKRLRYYKDDNKPVANESKFRQICKLNGLQKFLSLSFIHSFNLKNTDEKES